MTEENEYSIIASYSLCLQLNKESEVRFVTYLDIDRFAAFFAANRVLRENFSKITLFRFVPLKHTCRIIVDLIS